MDRTLFEHCSLTVNDGDRIGIVGTNGTGKSTLLRILAGTSAPDEGAVRWGRGARVGFLEQEPELPEGSVSEAVGDTWEAKAALDRLGMSAHAGADVTTLSGGQAKRVAMARVMSRPFELLILDEPTNHLDLGAVAWLEQRLATFKGGLVLVTHDRYLLDRLTTRMVEIDRGRVYVHEGGYESYLEARVEREERAAASEATRQNLARRELAWLRRGAQARSRKPQARVNAAKTLIAARPEPPERPGDLDLGVEIPRLGDQVVELEQVSFRYGSGPLILRNVTFGLDRRDRLGIVGANGTGKSTLVDLLVGKVAPTAGTVEKGPSVVIGYYDQRGMDLDPEARVQDLVAGPGRTPGSLADVALMKRFWFSGELPYARVGSLSGGERRRLQLLLVIARRPNVLVLDEPTNDLDLDTLRVVEEFAESWPGALVVVSHDRSFLERTTERLLAVGSDGSVTPVAGGVEGWIARVTGDLAGARPGDLASRSAAGPPVAWAGSPPGAPTSPDGPVPASGTSGGPGPGPRSDGAKAGRRLREAEKAMAKQKSRRDRAMAALDGVVDHVELARLGKELAACQADLDAAEEAWLAVAEEMESSR